jgi:hypothetical protein
LGVKFVQKLLINYSSLQFAMIRTLLLLLAKNPACNKQAK